MAQGAVLVIRAGNPLPGLGRDRFERLAQLPPPPGRHEPPEVVGIVSMEVV